MVYWIKIANKVVVRCVVLLSMIAPTIDLCAIEPSQSGVTEMNYANSFLAVNGRRPNYKRNPYNNRKHYYKKGVNRKGKGINHRMRKYPDNFIALSVSGGYSNIFAIDKITMPMGLAGGTLGFGYEMHARNDNFWWSVMGEVEYLTSSLMISNEVGDKWINDNENYLAVMHYDIHHWRDYQQYLFLTVPVMVGYRTPRFYIGGGPKFMFCTYGHALNVLNYTTYATYDRYCDDFVDMPNHFYTQYTSTGASKLKYNNFNVALCFEMGTTVFDQTYDLVKQNYKKKHTYNPRLVMKLGLYAEYGLINLNASSGYGNLATVRINEAHTLDVIPLFQSSAITNKTVHPFYAGIKLTLLYNRHCRNCHGHAKVF